MIKSVVKIESIPIPDQEFIVPLIKSIPIYCWKKNLVVVDFASCAPVNIFFWTLSVENKIRARTANDPVDAFELTKKISRIFRENLFFSLKATNESKESEWLFLYGERGPKTFDRAGWSFVFLSLPFWTKIRPREKNLSDTLLLLGCWPPTCAILKRRLRNSGLDYATFTDPSTATLVTSHDELT